MLNVLAIDIGTNMGLTYRCPHDGLVCETRKLASPKEITEFGKSRLSRRCDPRIKRCFDIVSALHERLVFDVVCIEDVLFASSTYAVQLWSSLRAAVWLACQQRPVPGPYFEAVPVATLKKFATGSGSADKDQMLTAAKRKKLLDDFDGLDDNAVDSLHLFDWANQNLSRMTKA